MPSLPSRPIGTAHAAIRLRRQLHPCAALSLLPPQLVGNLFLPGILESAAVTSRPSFTLLSASFQASSNQLSLLHGPLSRSFFAAGEGQVSSVACCLAPGIHTSIYNHASSRHPRLTRSTSSTSSPIHAKDVHGHILPSFLSVYAFAARLDHFTLGSPGFIFDSCMWLWHLCYPAQL